MSIKFIFDLDNTLYNDKEVNNISTTTFYNSFKKKNFLNNSLHNTPYKKYIFSNGNKEHVDYVIKKMKIKSFFKKTATSDEYKNFLKPNINPYNFIINKFKLKKEDIIVFFEDSLSNLETAKKQFNWITVYINDSVNKRYSFVDFTFRTIEEAINKLSKKRILDYKHKNNLLL